MSSDVAIPFENYEHIASAGIWDVFPFRQDPSEEDLARMNDEQLALLAEVNTGLAELTADTPAYPYLRLLLNRSPNKKEDLLVFQPALTQTPEEPFIPPVETDDNLAFMAENHLVLPRYSAEDVADKPAPAVYDPQIPQPAQRPSITLEALLPKSVRPIGLHQPIVDALGRLMASLGATWDPTSLAEVADVGTDFYTFRTEVPDETVDLVFDDTVYRVFASGIVAAGLRMAVCHTIRLSQWRPLVERLKDDPGAVRELVEREARLAALEGGQSPYLQLPDASA